jgi:predicted nucleotidyltransferase
MTMMKVKSVTQEEARVLAKRCTKLLQEQFGVRRAVLFGSVVGDAPWHSRSDVDIAVEGLRPEDHWQATNACYELLPPGLELDLIPIESAWPELRARIEGEIAMPQDSVEALSFEIKNELDQIERVVSRLVEFLERAPDAPDEVQIQGAAKHLHDFYNGVEHIFERIAIRIDEDLPAGSNCHTLLLQRMSRSFGSRRSVVIDRAMEQELSEYLRFRHVFRHTYGYDLKWSRIQELAEALPELLKRLRDRFAAFLSTLPGSNSAE